MFFLINSKINQIFQITYLRGLEIAELNEEDMPMVYGNPDNDKRAKAPIPI